jgi:O-antigen/teichoic acid export membrane protein
MEQIVIQQFLMASTSNKSIFIVSSVGAVIGILGNIVLTTRLGAVGSAMSWGLSELSVLVVGMYLVKKILGLVFDAKILLKNIGWALCYLPVPIVFSCYLEVPYGLRIAVEGLLMACIFALINLKFNKNELVITELRKMMQKIHFGKSR